MAVNYEWDVEIVEVHDGEDGKTEDVIEHLFQASFADCLRETSEPAPEGCRFEIVLVCNDDKERSWAYLANGKLPESFEDAYGGAVRKVPQRFHNEVANVPVDTAPSNPAN